MFKNERYLSRGVCDTIPVQFQLFMWGCIDHLPEESDYLQVFDFEQEPCIQSITHRAENPEYRKVYRFPKGDPIKEKVYVIDDGDHSTMLLASEY